MKRMRRRGVAMLWTLVGIVILSLLGIAANQLARDDRVVGQNYEAGQRALYFADEGLTNYFGTFSVSSDLTSASLSASVLDPGQDMGVDDAGASSETSASFKGADLKAKTFDYPRATVVVTPTKTMESSLGDVYMLESHATVKDGGASRPVAERRVRTFAELVSPLKILGALTAAGGIAASVMADHLDLDGKRKGSCGSGTDIPALVTPMGNPALVIKKHIGPLSWDSTAGTYQELVDSLGIDWVRMTTASTYSGLKNVIRIPEDYANIESVPYSKFSSDLWPITYVRGSHTPAANINGFGLLVVEGDLIIPQQFHWRGLILAGKGIHVTTDKSHLHAFGAAVTGLGCTPTQLLLGSCRTTMDGKGAHLGVSYQLCDIENAWSQLLDLKPLTPSRHTRFF